MVKYNKIRLTITSRFYDDKIASIINEFFINLNDAKIDFDVYKSLTSRGKYYNNIHNLYYFIEKVVNRQFDSMVVFIKDENSIIFTFIIQSLKNKYLYINADIESGWINQISNKNFLIGLIKSFMALDSTYSISIDQIKKRRDFISLNGIKPFERIKCLFRWNFIGKDICEMYGGKNELLKKIGSFEKTENGLILDLREKENESHLRNELKKTLLELKLRSLPVRIINEEKKQIISDDRIVLYSGHCCEFRIVAYGNKENLNIMKKRVYKKVNCDDSKINIWECSIRKYKNLYKLDIEGDCAWSIMTAFNDEKTDENLYFIDISKDLELAIIGRSISEDGSMEEYYFDKGNVITQKFIEFEGDFHEDLYTSSGKIILPKKIKI